MTKQLFLLVAIVSAISFGAKPTGFIFFGDWGTGTKEQKEVANGMKSFCKSNKCDYAVLLGDNFYPDGVASVKDKQWKEKFEDIYSPLNLMFYVTLGNHDHYGNFQAQIDYSKQNQKWFLPSRYYTFTKGNVQFIMLDTEKFDKPQVKWFREMLEESRLRSEWTIVVGHHPVYSYGSHGNTGYLIEEALPLMKDSVDFYLAGHDHDLQVLERHEMQFIVSGAAGKLRPVGEGKDTLFASSQYGFAHMQIEGEEAEFAILDKTGKPIYGNRRLSRKAKARNAAKVAVPAVP